MVRLAVSLALLPGKLAGGVFFVATLLAANLGFQRDKLAGEQRPHRACPVGEED